ncbi:hypothetical protein R3P38DRAFT_2770616 [Favolaschia claudopus]|uniref:Bacteriophage T5 Orf172 DNA-binding domain-containing protein n=1 Tax=Favolaschia claudopus TaxID=2862362 RepID=A0AAW0CHF3_9AGAR
MSSTAVIQRPARWSTGERRRRAFMKRFSRMTAIQRLRILRNINPYQDYRGFIYAFTQRVYNASGVYIGTRVKYGLTNNIDRRRREYRDCGVMQWISYWKTGCAKLTEATIHARLRARGINITKVDFTYLAAESNTGCARVSIKVSLASRPRIPTYSVRNLDIDKDAGARCTFATHNGN